VLGKKQEQEDEKSEHSFTLGWNIHPVKKHWPTVFLGP